MVPGKFIHEEWQPAIVHGVLKRQYMIMQKCKQEQAKFGQQKTDPNCFLILDDCLYDNGWARDKGMRYVFMNGRHLKILTLITMQ